MMLAAEYINPEKGVQTAEGVLTGAMDIIAEKIPTTPTYVNV